MLFIFCLSSNLCTKLIILTCELHVWNQCREVRHPLFPTLFGIMFFKFLSGLPEMASRSAVFKRNNHSKFLVVPILSRDCSKAEHRNLYSVPVKGWGSQGQSGPHYVWFLMQYFYDYLIFTEWLYMNGKVFISWIICATALIINDLNCMCRSGVTFGTRLVNPRVYLPPLSQFNLSTTCS